MPLGLQSQLRNDDVIGRTLVGYVTGIMTGYYGSRARKKLFLENARARVAARSGRGFLQKKVLISD
jgi:hypothetical protein